MINKDIKNLLTYGIDTGLIEKEDQLLIRNLLLDLLGMDEYCESQIDGSQANNDLETVLCSLLDYGYKNGKLKENSLVYRDLFDTKIMGILTPRPSEVSKKFWNLYKTSPREATDYYYKLSQDTDYIRRYRIEKDIKWVADTEYGEMDITINLSKPEKDPKDIAAAKLKKQSGYPKCLLCKENVGFSGSINHPARQNHRTIEIMINQQDWAFQYSPYVYYNEHCIVFNHEHIPMKIEKETFRKLLDFVKIFPHYFVGSNADLPIVGGSILSHDHFQGGHYDFAMAKAAIEKRFNIEGFEDVEIGIVKWPMSVIRLRAKEDEKLVLLSDKILKKWREYSDETVGVYAYSDDEPHNTITPIARMVDGVYEMDLVLRNNLTTKEHPLGVFHPHQELHHIKKENIGLIEVMGLAVLPARLKEEIALLEEYILMGKDIYSNEMIAKHGDWVNELITRHEEISKDNIKEIMNKEIGSVFSQVLEHAGVYKRDEKGREAFERFILSI